VNTQAQPKSMRQQLAEGQLESELKASKARREGRGHWAPAAIERRIELARARVRVAGVLEAIASEAATVAALRDVRAATEKLFGVLDAFGAFPDLEHASADLIEAVFELQRIGLARIIGHGHPPGRARASDDPRDIYSACAAGAALAGSSRSWSYRRWALACERISVEVVPEIAFELGARRWCRPLLLDVRRAGTVGRERCYHYEIGRRLGALRAC
jgi:hypothetical protein